MRSTKCPDCNAKVPANSMTCPYCGAMQPTGEDETNFNPPPQPQSTQQMPPPAYYGAPPRSVVPPKGTKAIVAVFVTVFVIIFFVSALIPLLIFLNTKDEMDSYTPQPPAQVEMPEVDVETPELVVPVIPSDVEAEIPTQSEEENSFQTTLQGPLPGLFTPDQVQAEYVAENGTTYYTVESELDHQLDLISDPSDPQKILFSNLALSADLSDWIRENELYDSILKNQVALAIGDMTGMSWGDAQDFLSGITADGFRKHTPDGQYCILHIPEEAGMCICFTVAYSMD